MKKVNYGTFTNPPSMSFANYCDGLDAKRQGDTSRAIYERLQKLEKLECYSLIHIAHNPFFTMLLAQSKKFSFNHLCLNDSDIDL